MAALGRRLMREIAYWSHRENTTAEGCHPTLLAPSS
jgi:hypothetical protein